MKYSVKTYGPVKIRTDYLQRMNKAWNVNGPYNQNIETPQDSGSNNNRLKEEMGDICFCKSVPVVFQETNCMHDDVVKTIAEPSIVCVIYLGTSNTLVFVKLKWKSLYRTG